MFTDSCSERTPLDSRPQKIVKIVQKFYIRQISGFDIQYTFISLRLFYKSTRTLMDEESMALRMLVVSSLNLLAFFFNAIRTWRKSTAVRNIQNSICTCAGRRPRVLVFHTRRYRSLKPCLSKLTAVSTAASCTLSLRRRISKLLEAELCGRSRPEVGEQPK